MVKQMVPGLARITVLILAVGIFLYSFYIFSFYKNEKERKFLTVAFLDVGQGDSIFIEAPNGFQVLIDGGPDSKVVRELSKILPFYDREIDLVIATHGDSDHIGGLPEVFSRYKILHYGHNRESRETNLFGKIDELAEKEIESEIFLESGQEIILDQEKNIVLKILWPPRDYFEKESDSNDGSIVVLLDFNEVEFVLTGDAGQGIEEKILKVFKDDLQNIEVLKAGHHGSKTSTSLEFLKGLNPEYAIISAGLDNKYGHPNEETLEKLKQNKIEVLETSKLGSIIFKTDGSKLFNDFSVF